MSDYKYYTPVALFDVLLDYLPSNRISSVIDISCGSFNLLKSAHKKFPEATCIGVDIEDQAANSCNDIQFIRQDGREYAKVQHNRKKRFDLILSNPPFGKLKKEDRLFEKDEGAILCSRYECEMMYANSLLAKNGTSMIVIMPATFVEGDLYIKYRKKVANDYTVKAIIKLPGDVFSKGNISSYAIILYKSPKQSKSLVQIGSASFENDRWKVVFSGNTCIEKMMNGIWVESIKPVSLVEKKDINAIFRGNISSAFFSKSGEKVLHCSSIVENEVWRPSQYFCEGVLNTNRKYAQAGDILINRIGKKAGFWAKYHGERQLVSDCIIVVRGKGDLESFLEKHSVHGRLIVPVKGVATKYIAIKDIVDSYFNIEKDE